MATLAFDIPLSGEKGVNLEDQVKYVNENISHLNDSVSSLERGLKKASPKTDDPLDYDSTLVMLLGVYQELNEGFINLSNYCWNLKNRFSYLPEGSINREYKIKQRLDRIHQTINSLLYTP